MSQEKAAFRVLAVHGSPRNEGNTRRIAQAVIDRLREREGSIVCEEIRLSALDLPLCKGCMGCFARGEDVCPHAERVQEIEKKVRAADLLIVTSPVYSMQLSATAKNWFDHMAYRFHRPAYFGKVGLVVVSTAGGGAKQTAKYMQDVLYWWGMASVYMLPVVTYADRYALTKGVEAKADRIAERALGELRNGARPPKVARVIAHNMWRAMASTWPEGHADERYWRETGMAYEPYPRLYLRHPVKRAIGAGAYRLMRRFMQRGDKGESK